LLRWLGASLLAVAIAGALYSIMKLSPLYAQLGAAKSATEPIRSYSSALHHPLRWLNTNCTLQVVPPLVVFAAFGLVQVVRIVSRVRIPAAALAAVVAAGIALLLLPAFVFDGQVLADPNAADYPGTSDGEYATGWPAGNAWVAVAHEIDRLAARGTTSVTVYDQGSNAFPLSLHTTLVPGGNDARYVIENGKPIPADHGPVELHPIWEYKRPRNGVVLRLYERGVTVRGRFYATPAVLRSGLGLGDKEFDAYVASHPEVKAWYDGVVSVGS
jgi:hypothetical protein